MRRSPHFIGDEVTAAGFRLAGLRTTVPDPGEEAAALCRACEEAHLVLITAEVAAKVPQSELRRLQGARRPLLLIVPDARERVSAPDLGAGLRKQLGLTE